MYIYCIFVYIYIYTNNRPPLQAACFRSSIMSLISSLINPKP